MELGELEVAVKVLQDSFSGLARDHTRIQEVNVFLEQRVRKLEQHLSVQLSPRPQQGCDDDEGNEGKLIKVPSETAPKGAVVRDSAGEESKGEEPDEEVRGRELDGEEQEIPLASSSWDACLLVGSPALGVWGSLITIMCVLVNSCIQVIFCALVAANFIGTEFSTTDLIGLKAWRLRVAHDDRYRSQTGSSLASRVCGLDPTLELSNEQAAKVDLIRSYSPTLDSGRPSSSPFLSQDWMKDNFDGPVMCLVAVACWVLTVAKEVGGICDLLGVVLAMPGSRGLGVKVASSSDGFEIRSAGLGSKAFMICVCALRLSIAVGLLIMGILYLAYTSSMQDLLLNAVALECVMTVDELVYEALAPRRIRQIMGKLAPLKLPPWPRKMKLLDLKTTGLFLLLLGMVVYVQLGPLNEHSANLKVAHDNMCAGDLDFTMSSDTFSMLHTMPASGYNEIIAFAELSTPQDRAVQELIDRTPWQNLAYTLHPTLYGFTSLQLLRAANQMDQVAGIYSHRSSIGCHDALDLTLRNMSSQEPHLHVLWPDFEKERRVWLNYLNHLKAYHGMSAGTTCEDFVALCWSPLVYSLCPVTCNCDSLMGGVVDDSLSSGCPTICRQSVKRSEKIAVSCKDAEAQNADDPKWAMLLQWSGSFPNQIKPLLQTHGCPLLGTALANWLCAAPSWLQTPTRTNYAVTDAYTFKVFSYLCPESCGCGGRVPPASAVVDQLGGRASPARVPSSAACPDSCVCPWTFPVNPSRSVSACGTFPYYLYNYTVESVNASGQCCYLMRYFGSLMVRQVAGEQVNAEFGQLLPLLCHPCWTSCFDLLWSLRVLEANLTFPSGYFMLMHGTPTVTQSAQTAMGCSTILP